LSAGQTISISDLDNSNVAIGNKVIDAVGNIFEIASVDTANSQVTLAAANWDNPAVRFSAQTLTDAEKVQACANIGADKVVASGTGYIRYESGLQICWGAAAKAGTSTTVQGQIYSLNISDSQNFPVPFVELQSVLVTNGGNAHFAPCLVGASNTAVNLVSAYRSEPGTDLLASWRYIAIGLWK
jgi:hypothetical protein